MKFLRRRALDLAPALMASLSFYRLLRRQRREFKRAARDDRDVDDLIAPSGVGDTLTISNREIPDPRVSVGLMQCIQQRDELIGLLDRVRALHPSRLLEIGTSSGGTLYLLTRVATRDAIVISLDTDIPVHTRAARSLAARPGQHVISVEGDSHSPAVKARVEDLLAGELLDFLFIDGDHTYEGVRADFETYSPLVRAGGLIALHDINPVQDLAHGGGAFSGDVPRFWKELTTRRSEELIANPGQNGLGIGLVWVDTA